MDYRGRKDADIHNAVDLDYLSTLQSGLLALEIDAQIIWENASQLPKVLPETSAVDLQPQNKEDLRKLESQCPVTVPCLASTNSYYFVGCSV